MASTTSNRISRLRRAFRYATDTDIDSLPEHLDDEEQDALIARIRDLDDRQNTIYTYFFTFLYLIPIINSLLHFLSRPTTLEFLSLTSYIITTFSIYFIPVRTSSSKGKQKATVSIFSKIGLPHYEGYLENDGPVNKFLPYLNTLLVATIAVGHYVSVSRMKRMGEEVDFYRESIGYLPLILFIMSVIIRKVMVSVDVSELEEKRYKYKGA